MVGFQYFLESFLVLYALLSDYVLVLDQWIITAPAELLGNATHASKSYIRRRRWIAALNTSVAYALFEPVCYWFITAVSSNAIWWAIVCGYIHIFAVGAAIRMMDSAILKVKREHEEVCMSELQEGISSRNTRANDEGEEDDDLLLNTKELDRGSSNEVAYEVEAGNQASNPAAAGGALGPTPCKNHKVSISSKLALFLPTFTGAATNAGLFLYAQYLGTENSRQWLDGNSFGWTAVVILIIICTCIFKYMNIWMHIACNRHVLPLGPWELGQRLSCLTILLLLRAGLRAILGQYAFARIGTSETDRVLILNDAGDGDGKDRAFDRALKSIPPWVGMVCSGLIIIGWGGYGGFRLVNRNRRHRQDHA